MLGAEGVEETLARGRIVNRVAGRHDLVAARAQHPHHPLQCLAPHCVDERRDCFVGSAVALLRQRVGHKSEERRRYSKGCEPLYIRKPAGSEN
jgi:hypothetical protein